MAAIRLTPVQKDMLRDFADGDRYVPPRYRRTADALVRAGMLKPHIGGWYRITPTGTDRAGGL